MPPTVPGYEAAGPEQAPADFNMAAFMGTGETSGPTAEQTAAGILEQLQQVLVIANAVAVANPALAEPMRQMRQIAVESLLQTQQAVGGGSPSQMAMG